MRWATRNGVHIDRAACAWLIRRFIDPQATFLFVTDPDQVPADATAFDMRGVELSHHGGDCTFETILRRHDLTDPVLWRIAQIVHEADLDDQRYDAPEAAGLDVILRGLSLTCADEQTLAVSGPIFDGLYEFSTQPADGSGTGVTGSAQSPPSSADPRTAGAGRRRQRDRAGPAAFLLPHLRRVTA